MGNYEKGIKWYSQFFPKKVSSNPKDIILEKSSVYFFGDQAPLRLRNLNPEARLIAILKNPIDRAYSFYHHVRHHKWTAALNYSFYEVFLLTISLFYNVVLNARVLVPSHWQSVPRDNAMGPPTECEGWRRHS